MGDSKQDYPANGWLTHIGAALPLGVDTFAWKLRVCFPLNFCCSYLVYIVYLKLKVFDIVPSKRLLPKTDGCRSSGDSPQWIDWSLSASGRNLSVDVDVLRTRLLMLSWELVMSSVLGP